MQVTRAAFDVGSGQTKIVIAQICGGRVKQQLFSHATDVLVGHDFNKHKTGALSQEIIQELMATMRLYKKKADEFNAPCAGIATEVFRRASNGSDVLQQFTELGIHVEIISQELEGRLGFSTASILSDLPQDNVISWDSGSSSFQLVGKVDGKLQVYEGPLGSSVVTKLLVEEVQQKSLKDTPTPNPVSEAEANQLLECIQSKIEPTPTWLHEKLSNPQNKVIAIGGNTNCFRMISILQNQKHNTAEDVEQALAKTLMKTDQELSFLPINEPVVSKISIVRGVMKKHNIQEWTHFEANGNCLAVLVEDEFWEPRN